MTTLVALIVFVSSTLAVETIDWFILMVIVGIGVRLVAVVVFTFAVIKRLHDLDQNGGLAGLLIVPVVNIALYLLFGVKSGDPAPNRFGPPGSGSVR